MRASDALQGRKRTRLLYAIVQGFTDLSRPPTGPCCNIRHEHKAHVSSQPMLPPMIPSPTSVQPARMPPVRCVQQALFQVSAGHLTRCILTACSLSQAPHRSPCAEVAAAMKDDLLCRAMGSMCATHPPSWRSATRHVAWCSSAVDVERPVRSGYSLCGRVNRASQHSPTSGRLWFSLLRFHFGRLHHSHPHPCAQVSYSFTVRAGKQDLMSVGRATG